MPAATGWCKAFWTNHIFA